MNFPIPPEKWLFQALFLTVFSASSRISCMRQSKRRSPYRNVSNNKEACNPFLKTPDPAGVSHTLRTGAPSWCSLSIDYSINWDKREAAHTIDTLQLKGFQHFHIISRCNGQGALAHTYVHEWIFVVRREILKYIAEEWSLIVIRLDDTRVEWREGDGY